ncbi:D-3-phosphoglycerate dehydrogenase [Halopenitus malekzadehii]|uniref:D-3-phosphoglycerate dehydrogenase n=1 Tax=Halopenitus malekzadehii TaxID=1267564 RepID=A0A1H6I5E0_9EURY|nr:C-terminal binding protein [Halopenitus malekzadehii]SEH42012.1 D-3-phosphoglycerate dehydrogenase [Halopenitus malekzadehii]
MTGASSTPIVGVTAGSAFDLDIEREVFDDMDVRFHPVDVETTDDLIAELADADAVIDRLLSAPYTAAVIDALENCRIIARCGIGVDAIDIDRAAAAGTYVVNVPSYCQDEVSEHTMLLLLALERNLTDYDAALKDGVWARDVTAAEVHRLRGRTLGLIGFGTIARLVAEKARAFGLDVMAADPYVDAETMAEADVEKVPFETVLETADAVSLHAPLIEDTRGMMDADAFARMKESAVLINVARGGLVVTEDLVDALRTGQIAGAGLDVFDVEPSGQGGADPPFESPLREFDTVVLTPHVAWFSREANDERRRTAARDVRRVLEGRPPTNAVNDPEGANGTSAVDAADDADTADDADDA